MDDKNTAFLAALAGLADSPTPSTRDEAMLKAIVERLIAIQTAATTAELPEVESTDKDKYLHTKSTDGSLEWVAGELPPIPDTDGDYELLLTVSSGEPVLTWEAIEA